MAYRILSRAFFLSVYAGRSIWKKHVCAHGNARFGSPGVDLRVICAREPKSKQKGAQKGGGGGGGGGREGQRGGSRGAARRGRRVLTLKTLGSHTSPTGRRLRPQTKSMNLDLSPGQNSVRISHSSFTSVLSSETPS